MKSLHALGVLFAVCLLAVVGTTGRGMAASDRTSEVSLSEASLTFWGEDIGDWSGYSVSPAGDVNNDGFDDILIGAPYAGVGGPKGEGKAYLVLGRPRSQWSGNHISLKDNETSFLGYGMRSMTGRQNYTAGDVNGDGFDDFLVTTWKYQDQRGSVSLFLGRATIPWGRDHPVAQADATFVGEDSLDRAGWYATTAGDVNGDGYDDFLITAVGDEEGGGFRAGQIYLILGRPAADWGRRFSLGQADASFLGTMAGEGAGRSASGAGDVNGDGYDDFIIGAIYGEDLDAESSADAGKAYLILGRAAADWGMDYSLAQADASFAGEAAGDQVGRRVAGAGDVNGDGYDDMLLGASYNDQVAPDAGKAYLILGRPQADWGLDFPLSQADASFLGEGAGDQAGRRVSDAGDINHDGYADFMIGAPQSSRAYTEGGVAYLLFGRPAADWGSDYPLAQADAAYLAESAYDHAGFDVAPAGDMDGDGVDDFVIGAWNGNEHGTQCGQTYVMLSDNSPAPLRFIPDTPDGKVGEWHGFTGEYWDPNGWTEIAQAELSVGREPHDRKGLSVLYEPANNFFYLWDNNAFYWIGPCAAGDPVTLSNGITELDCSLSGIQASGEYKVRVVSRARWIQPILRSKTMKALLRASDQAGNESGYQELGSWTLLPAVD